MSRFNRRELLCLAASASWQGAIASSGPVVTRDASAIPARRPTLPVRCGGSRLITVDGQYRVWTKHVGPATGPQVLTLHGGPGATHFYLECFEDFLPPAGIGFYYYDQLGCGFSDQPEDKSLWTVERFCAEVEEVRAGLGLAQCILFGHSWGGMLAIEYALHYPHRLRGLVISNMAASVASYGQQLERIRNSLPTEVRAQFSQFEAAGDYASAQYQQLLMTQFYRKHLCRLEEWPEPLQRALRFLSAPVYNTMQGPDEFHITGNFKSWDRWHDLARVQVPTLVIGGRHDEMSPDDLLAMGRLLPHARTVICENGSHLCMYDDQDSYFSSLVEFLRGL